MNKFKAQEILPFIDPAQLSYQEWVNVGMILKDEGYSCDIWDEWSRRDSRYKPHDCSSRWGGFGRGSGGANVTMGTLVQYALEQGWSPHSEEDSNSYALDWDSCIGRKDEAIVVNPAWVEGQEITEPPSWHPAQQLITYLETLFEPDENVGYVTTSWERDGRVMPTQGNYARTSGELIDELRRCKDDLGSVLGDYDPAVGAWIRFNPLDGKGVKNDNVTAYRYALVESDDMDLAKQNAIIRELELPVACLVHSGKKSLHAIVHIDADNYEQYRKRVDYLYTICKKNGLSIDTQNRNPSRLSRMPGVMRNGRKQFLIGTNIGKSSWGEWQEWISSVNDDLPDVEGLVSVWDNLPPLSPSLIDGILRQGHKMLLAGPSKAGKSYALIELCIAIAEGRKWLSRQCAQGKVLYVNLELDRASCLHRFKEVYETSGLEPKNLSNIDVWNLRGKSVPMDMLAPKLIARAAKKGYRAVIIDPIYKVITGDENSAEHMAKFCNQFDKICTELKCSVIYCHHHSKGAQGDKQSMDRASGSGVFARDPDALLDMIELDVTDALRKAETNRAIIGACMEALNQVSEDWEDKASQDDLCSSSAMEKLADRYLDTKGKKTLSERIERLKRDVGQATAWRISGTIREFAPIKPINVWFRYPIHIIDDCEALQDLDYSYGGKAAQFAKGAASKKEQTDKTKAEFENAILFLSGFNDVITVKDLTDYTGKSESTIRKNMRKYGYVEDDFSHSVTKAEQ